MKAHAGKLRQRGYTQERAERLATFVTASLEGGIMLSRTNHSNEPLKVMADELAAFIQAAPKG